MAEVVQQVVRLADTDVLVEAWADPEAPPIDIEEAVIQVRYPRKKRYSSYSMLVNFPGSFPDAVVLH